ncbi:branched-chain amino acid ABC transporter substrate-binding protein [Amycolatopsis jejuensis]|uniref:branched-chain amino acid ABC transporter substrate-binding protein n=1 Tax=Amycolatopsis jejuensis TaxID=330084 RepID=UPI00052771DC|nr:branched-chain amino acid ABC transporter substrate-binding protein [Amycolatopsis jejuensis]
MMRTSHGRRPARLSTKMTAAGALAALALAVTGCGGGAGAAKDSAVTIGLAAPYSGSAAYYGEWLDQAWQLAFDEFGHNVNGREIKLAKADAKCEPSAAVAATRSVLAENPLSIITICSGDTRAALPIASAKKVPIVSGSYDPSLTAEGNKYIFRVQTHDGVTNQVYGKWILGRAGQNAKIGVISDTTPYGLANNKTITAGFAAAGVTPAASATYDSSATDYAGQLLALKRAGVNVAYLEGYDLQAARIVKQANQLGLDAKFYFPTTASSDTFLQTAGTDLANKVIYSTPFLPEWSDAAKQFSQKWQKRFGTLPNADCASFYTMAVTMLTTLRNNPDAGKSAEAFTTAYRNIKIPNLPMGDFAFDPNGDPVNPLVIAGTWENGQRKLVDVLLPAQAK